MSAIQTWALSSRDLSVPASLRSSSTCRNTWAVCVLISPTIGLGVTPAIGDRTVNDCLADDGLTPILVRYLSNFVPCDRHDIPFWIECLGVLRAAYSNGSMTIEPVVLRPPMNSCAAAASRSGKVFTTLLATTPCATASNKDFAAVSISVRVDM
jgi:hypothetical protein